MKKVLSLFLVVAMIIGNLTVVSFDVKASSSRTLYCNETLLKQVGKQTPYSYSCACFALAYCRTMLDGYVHYYYEYNNWVKDEYNISCRWYDGDYYTVSAGNKANVFKACYDSINNNRPVVLHVINSTGQHWVTVVGYQNVTSVSNMSEGNLLVIDPVHGYTGAPQTLSKYSLHSDYRYATTNSGSVIPNSTPTPDFVDINAGDYYFKHNATGKYMDVQEAQDVNDTDIQLWDFNGSSAQLFTIAKDNGGYYIKPDCSSTRLVIGAGDYIVSGANVCLWVNTNGSTQRWKFQKVSGGFAIHNTDNLNCAMDINGSSICLKTFNSGSNQVWTLQNSVSYDANGGSGAPAMQMKNYGEAATISYVKPTRTGYTFLGWSADSSATVPTYESGDNYTANENIVLYAVWGKKSYQFSDVNEGTYYIKNMYTGKYLNIVDGNDQNNADVHTYTYGGYTSQQYTIRKVSDKYELMPNCSTSRVISAIEETVTHGERIILWDRTNHDSQLWRFEKVANGYVIRNAQNPDLCAVVDTSNGYLYVAEYTGSSNQIWSLEETCTIKYDANGGSDAPTSQKVRMNYESVISTKEPTRKCHTFLGWSTDKNAVTASLKKGEVVTVYESITLYAVFGNANHQYTNEYDDTCNVCDHIRIIEGDKTGDCYWKLDGTVLTIFGNGTMANYNWENEAPWGTNITKVIIEDGVTAIGDRAFWNCTGLTTVTIPDSVTTIGDSAFSGCAGLTSVTIGDSVTTIGDYAFSGCTGLTSITIPDSVTAIGGGAFDDCTSLTSITIPDSVTTIGDYAFFGCDTLTVITVDEDNAAYCDVDGVLFNKDKTTLVYYPMGKTTTVYTIPDGVTTIGERAFYDCTALTTVTIPDGVVAIGSCAFFDCYALKTATIPDSVSTIGNAAFFGCSALTTITIPDSVSTIASETFLGCSALTMIIIPDSVTAIGWGAFSRCDALTDVYYAGGEEQAAAIQYGSVNGSLLNATWHYNYQIPQTNGWVSEGGKWAYYKDGVKQTNCWQKDSVGWCYLGADGYCVTNCWKKDSHGWCYLNSEGRMATNCWVRDSKGWCYLGADGYAVTNCWKKDSVGWCYLDANGSMTKSAWVYDGGKWYYCDANGYMVSNKWMKDSKGWVYLGANGAMVTNKWVRDSVGWCYVGADGYAVTNCWKKDSVGWCYLNANGSMTKSAWVQDGGKWYYLDANGYMVANKTITISGKKYTFNASGVWVS